MVRVLLLGSDTPLGNALLERHHLLQRHEMLPSTLSACRWKSERQAKKSVVRAKCDIVVDLRIEAAADGGISIQERDLQRCRWVAKACQRNDSAYLYVSSSRVFSGALGRHYNEDDQPDNEESIGSLLRRGEDLVAGTCERHLILRLGPVFSYEGTNLVSQMLEPLREGGSLRLDDNLRGSPVAARDGARVLLAMLDQLGTGIEPWGIYHYGSSDTATFYEFAEALLASASQFFEVSASAVQLEREPERLQPLNRALDCTKILNTFAIRQITWRSAMGDIVKQYYDRQQSEGV